MSTATNPAVQLLDQYQAIGAISNQNTFIIKGTNFLLGRAGILESQTKTAYAVKVICTILTAPFAFVEEVARAALSPIAALFLFMKNDRLNTILFNNFFAQAITVLGVIAFPTLSALLLVATTVSCCFCCCCCCGAGSK